VNVLQQISSSLAGAKVSTRQQWMHESP